MRVACFLFLAAIGVASLQAGEPRYVDDVGYDGNYIAAIVNETIITRGQVEKYTYRAIEPLFRLYQRPEVLEHKVREVLSDGLEQLIENQLILDDFKAAGAKVPDAIVEDEIKDQLRQRYHDRATLIKELHAQGMTPDELKQQIRERIVLQYMTQKNVSSAILISPQKIESYYATNLHRFQLGNQVKLRMIVLRCSSDSPLREVRQLAREISLKIDEGASFAEMASIYSEGSERKQGGDLGWMEVSKTTKGFADVAAALTPGQHSGVLGFARDTNEVYWMYQYNTAGQLVLGRKYADKVGGDKNELLEEKKFETATSESDLPAAPQEFRLMYVEDKKVARTESLAEARERIEKELISQERERLRKRWVDHLRAKAFVRLF